MRAKRGHGALGNHVGSMRKEYAGAIVARDPAEAGEDIEVDPMTRALNSEA